ncbi:alpha/beta fold hydrolase [Microbacterium sp.]|uniref:alpha/beta fold hydrolase n=1 Tax=Microbacterium sp. TaxID=51671 RepID=UPI0037CAACB8
MDTAPDDQAARLDAELTPIDWTVLPPGSERDTVAVPSGSLARVSLGPAEGERVVLVPGMTGSKEDFTLMLPLFAEAGYRAEAFDMAGQYESAAAGPEHLDPPRRRYTLDLFVDDLIAILDGGRTPAHVLGYSFAGTVAGAAAVRQPELFSTLTLLSAPPLPGQALRGFKVLGPLSHAVPGRALGPLFISALRRNVHRAPRDRAQFVTARFAHTRASSVGDIMALMKRTPDLAPALRATGIPLLVVTGTGDVWPAEVHREFAERLGARALVLPTGHSPCETAPHQLTQAMLALMRNGSG